MFGADTLVVLLVILVVVVVWRGPKTLPQIGEMLGRGVKAARREARDIRGEAGEAGKPGSEEPPPSI